MFENEIYVGLKAIPPPCTDSQARTEAYTQFIVLKPSLCFSTHVCVCLCVCVCACYYQGCYLFVHNLGEVQIIDKPHCDSEKRIHSGSISYLPCQKSKTQTSRYMRCVEFEIFALERDFLLVVSKTWCRANVAQRVMCNSIESF